MGYVIGNEVFKTIVTMACEMKLASQVRWRITQRREEVRKLMKAGQTFRDDEDIRKEMAKYLAISPDNKKHWRFDEGAEDTEHNGFVLKKEIALSISGRYRIMLSIVKHTEYEIRQHRQFENVLYVHIRDSDDEEVNEEYDRRYFIRNPPTVVTVEIIKRLGLCLEFSEVKEAYDDIYERVSYRGGKNARIWDRRIYGMRVDDKNSILARMISRRYGQDV
jgi:hypothetical protein